MEHVAIDLGGRESQICVRREDGEIIEEKRVATAHLGAYLKGRPHSRVVIETCAESFMVADAALELKHEVRVVAATLVKTLGVGARRTKMDVRDARVLSDVSTKIDLPSVHIPKKEPRQRKALCGMREGLVGARTQLINTVRGWMRTQVDQMYVNSQMTKAELPPRNVPGTPSTLFWLLHPALQRQIISPAHREEGIERTMMER